MAGTIVKTTGSVGFVAVLAIFAADRLSWQISQRAAVTSKQEPSTIGSVRPSSAPAEEGPFSVVLAADQRGHFTAEAVVNGTPLALLVDTGASVVALSEEDAHRAGIRPFPSDFTVQISTANGPALAAPVIIQELALGDISVRDVRAMVLQRGKLSGSLLGMSFLSRLSAFQVQGNKLVLNR